MKRIIPILVIIILIIGSLGAVAISNKEIDNDKEILESVILSDIKIIISDFQHKLPLGHLPSKINIF